MILFLDFDGVLHPFGCAADLYFCCRDELESWLRRRPGVDIVISSSWREAHPFEELRSFFSVDIQPRILGVTPILKRDSWEQYDSEPPPARFEREIEVTRWIAESKEPWRPWAALDDQAWLYKPFSSYLVVCDGKHGLTQRELDRLDVVLGIASEVPAFLVTLPDDAPLPDRITMPHEPTILPITAAEEAWLTARCAELDRLAAEDAIEDLETAPRHWPVVFLGLDHVVAANDAFGALSAREALLGGRTDAEQVFAGLWMPMAAAILQEVHARFDGRVRWVISSTWRCHFTRSQLREVFRRSGLGCVADGMEPRERWRTPSLLGQTRCHEVLEWIRTHHQGEPYVILDDEYSWGPSAHVAPGVEVPCERLVICREWEGLQPRHVPCIMAALKAPCSPDRRRAR